MALSRLDIVGVRNIRQQSLELGSGLNFFCGANGSGKSALIESVYILGRGRSFRSAQIRSVINHQSSFLLVAGTLVRDDQASEQIGIRLDGETFEIRINHQPSDRKSDLAYLLPLQLIYPKSYELLEGGSQLRREFIDWGVFHDNPRFLPVWRRFRKALLQRNALLKTGASFQLPVWDQELANYGIIVNELRKNYIDRLIPVFNIIADHFLALSALEIKLICGWNTDHDYRDVLIHDQEKDLRHGFTHSGPHRADFRLLIKGRLAKDFVSRGQSKLLVICLKLAQLQLLNSGSVKGCVLIDDFGAELDADNRARLLNYFLSIDNQIMMTATSPNDLDALDLRPSIKMFHVEHGKIKSL